jgi:hypothetical protein
MVLCGVEGVDGCAILSVSSVLRVGRKERVRGNGDLSGVLADHPQVVAPWATDLSLAWSQPEAGSLAQALEDRTQQS